MCALLGDLAIVAKREILRPGYVEENLQAVFISQIEKPFRGVVIDANAVGPELPHLSEVFGGLLAAGEELAGAIGGEGAVGDAFDVELFVAEAEEFSVPADAVGGRIDNALPAAAGGGGSDGSRGRLRFSYEHGRRHTETFFLSDSIFV